MTGQLPASLSKLSRTVYLCPSHSSPNRSAVMPTTPVRHGTEPWSAACLCAVGMRSGAHLNQLSGTIGSWIGSMAKLAYL